jgi:hypothetical protein
VTTSIGGVLITPESPLSCDEREPGKGNSFEELSQTEDVASNTRRRSSKSRGHLLPGHVENHTEASIKNGVVEEALVDGTVLEHRADLLALQRQMEKDEAKMKDQPQHIAGICKKTSQGGMDVQ